MKHEPTNNPWLYDKRPAADQGRDEATFDGQGFPEALPEKRGALNPYDQLKHALYEFGRAGHEHMTPDRFFEEKGFPDLAHSIREGWKDAKNNTRATWCYHDRLKRDAENQRSDEVHQIDDTELDRALSDAALYGSGVLHGGKHVPLSHQHRQRQKLRLIGALTDSGTIADTPAAHDFTAEEIEAVRRMRFDDLSYSHMAEKLTAMQFGSAFDWYGAPEGWDYWKSAADQKKRGTLTDDVLRKINRYAAVAQYLAETEEG